MFNIVCCSVADPHPFDADPDLTLHSDAEPDQTFHFLANSDPVHILHVKAHSLNSAHTSSYSALIGF